MAAVPDNKHNTEGPAPLRYFQNLRILEFGWLGIFNKPMKVKGFQFKKGAIVITGTYGWAL